MEGVERKVAETTRELGKPKIRKIYTARELSSCCYRGIATIDKHVDVTNIKF